MSNYKLKDAERIFELKDKITFVDSNGNPVFQLNPDGFIVAVRNKISLVSLTPELNEVYGEIGGKDADGNVVVKGLVGVSLDANSIRLTNGQDFDGAQIYMGEDGVLFYVFPDNPPVTISDNNPATIFCPLDLETDAGVSLNLSEDFEGASFSWNFQATNFSNNKLETVFVTPKKDTVLQTPITYRIDPNQTVLISGIIPFTGILPSATTLELSVRPTITDGIEIKNITIKLSMDGTGVNSAATDRITMLADEIDWSIGGTFIHPTLTGATVITDTLLPQGIATKTITLYVDGDFALTFPLYYVIVSGVYDGTKMNQIVLECVNGNSGTELVYVQYNPVG